MRQLILILGCILCLLAGGVADLYFKNQAIRATVNTTISDSLRIRQTVIRLKDSIKNESRFAMLNRRIDSVNARVDTVVVYLVTQSSKRERRRQRWEDVIKTLKNILL